MKSFLILFTLFSVVFMALPAFAGDRVTLVEKGEVRVRLVLPPNPTEYEALAAKEIAAHLNVSAHTVKEHLKNASGKLGARNGKHAVALFLETT